jgi:hypothetical protein
MDSILDSAKWDERKAYIEEFVGRYLVKDLQLIEHKPRMTVRLPAEFPEPTVRTEEAFR